MNTIPNIQVENIGTRQKPINAVRGFIELPCWTGYYLYDDSYRLKKDKVVLNGRIDLWVDGELTPDGSIHFLQGQINAYNYLVKQQEEVKQAILKTLAKDFPALLANEYAAWDHEEDFFPKLSELTPHFDFKSFIGPESISIEEEVKEDMAYVTWRFRCRWDIEHGFEVITHKDRIIDLSPDTDIWKIYRDNGTYEEKLKEFKEQSAVPKKPKKKKWWQFW